LKRFLSAAAHGLVLYLEEAKNISFKEKQNRSPS